MVTMTLTTTAWADMAGRRRERARIRIGAGMTSAWTWLIGNADFGAGGGVNTSQIVHGGNVSLSHIAVYPYVLPYYRVLDHYWAAVTAFGQLARAVRGAGAVGPADHRQRDAEQPDLPEPGGNLRS